jgi:hypothetical protein
MDTGWTHLSLNPRPDGGGPLRRREQTTNLTPGRPCVRGPRRDEGNPPQVARHHPGARVGHRESPPQPLNAGPRTQNARRVWLSGSIREEQVPLGLSHQDPSVCAERLGNRCEDPGGGRRDWKLCLSPPAPRAWATGGPPHWLSKQDTAEERGTTAAERNSSRALSHTRGTESQGESVGKRSNHAQPRPGWLR